MTNIASENQSFFNSLIGNNNKKVNAKFITFYKTFGGLGLLISKAQSGAYIAIANDDSSSIQSDIKFPSSKSNCTVLNNWHTISVTWFNPIRPGLFSRSPGQGGLRGPDAKNQG